MWMALTHFFKMIWSNYMLAYPRCHLGDSSGNWESNPCGFESCWIKLRVGDWKALGVFCKYVFFHIESLEIPDYKAGKAAQIYKSIPNWLETLKITFQPCFTSRRNLSKLKRLN